MKNSYKIKKKRRVKTIWIVSISTFVSFLLFIWKCTEVSILFLFKIAIINLSFAKEIQKIK